MKDKYIVIQQWMITELGLKGSELIAYALIYGLTIHESDFHGTADYLSTWLGITPKKCYRVLSSLCERGLLTRTENSRIVHYVANVDSSKMELMSSKMEPDSSKTELNSAKRELNNIIDNNTDNISDNIENAPVSDELFEVEKTEKKPRKKPDTIESLCLFADSKFYDYDLFAAQFTGPEYQEIDIAYYYGVVGDWSASKGAKKKDWIALTRIIMRKDKDANKLHLLPKNVGYGDSVLSPEAIKYLEMGRL